MYYALVRVGQLLSNILYKLLYLIFKVRINITELAFVNGPGMVG